MTEANNSSIGEEKIILMVEKKKVELRPYVSIGDINLVSAELQQSETIDYRSIVAKMIVKHTQNTFSLSEILSLDDSVFEEYIDKCLRSDERLRENYELLEIVDKKEKFVIAVDEAGKRLAKRLSETVGNHILETVPKVVESASLVQGSMTQLIPPVLKLSETISKATEALQDTLQSTWVSSLKTISNAYVNLIPEYSKAFLGISSAVQSFLSNLRIPTITEEDKKRLIDSYKAWGKLGWTVPPNAEINVFSKEPLDANDAYQRLRRYTNNTSMDELFTEIRELTHIKISDFDEAVACFKLKKYKACALILFSLIDSRLIRSQLDADRNRGMRSSGKKAAMKLFERVEAKYITEDMLFTILDQVNILAALETVFDNGNDFKKQPKVINRNFLDHGMLYRKVTRKDCVMLFLLLYNFTEHLNSFIVND